MYIYIYIYRERERDRQIGCRRRPLHVKRLALHAPEARLQEAAHHPGHPQRRRRRR